MNDIFVKILAGVCLEAFSHLHWKISVLGFYDIANLLRHRKMFVLLMYQLVRYQSTPYEAIAHLERRTMS